MAILKWVFGNPNFICILHAIKSAIVRSTINCCRVEPRTTPDGLEGLLVTLELVLFWCSLHYAPYEIWFYENHSVAISSQIIELNEGKTGTHNIVNGSPPRPVLRCSLYKRSGVLISTTSGVSVEIIIIFLILARSMAECELDFVRG